MPLCPVFRSRTDLLANLRRADLHIQPRQNVKRGVLSSGVAQLVGFDLNSGITRRRIGGEFKDNSLWQRRLQIIYALAWPRGDDQGRNKWNLHRPMPVPQRKKRVGAHQAKQNALRRKLRAQAQQRIQGEVGRARGLWRIHQRNGKARFAGHGQPGHGQAVFKAGGRPIRLERLRAYGGEEHSIQPERSPRSPRHSQMAQVGRIETAAKKSDALAAACCLIHSLILIRRCNAGRSSSILLNTMRYLIAILALAGIVVSVMALRVHYSTDTQPCSINETWDCGIVNHSPFAEIAHVPVAAIGVAGYLALAGLALARRYAWLAGLAMLALIFQLYLSHIEKSVLQVWCLYCVISLAIVSLITSLSWWWAVAAYPYRRRS